MSKNKKLYLQTIFYKLLRTNDILPTIHIKYNQRKCQVEKTLNNRKNKYGRS